MKRILFFVSIIILHSAKTFALEVDTSLIIKQIRVNYTKINKELCNYKKVFKKIMDESAEGGEVIEYYNNEELKKIEEVLYGEMGKLVMEYYFYNKKVFFVLMQDDKYNRPIYWDKERMMESNDTEIFDERKTVISKNKFYFYDDQLMLWMDDNGQPVPSNSGRYIEKSEWISEKIKRLLFNFK